MKITIWFCEIAFTIEQILEFHVPNFIFTWHLIKLKYVWYHYT